MSFRKKKGRNDLSAEGIDIFLRESDHSVLQYLLLTNKLEEEKAGRQHF